MDYGAVNSKVGAMRASLLTRADYTELLSAADTARVLELLGARASYGDIAPAYRDGGASGVEKALAATLYRDARGISAFIHDNNQQSLFQAFTERLDFNTVKLVLDCAGGVCPFSPAELLRVTGGRLKLNFAALLSARTAAEFVEHTRGSAFHAELSKQTQPTVWSLRGALDRMCTARLWKTVKRSRDAALTHIAGTDMDLNNIVNIYRLKAFYDADAKSVYPNLFPAGYRLNDDCVNAMAASASRIEFLDVLSGTAYAGYFNALSAGDDAALLENARRTALRDACRRARTRYPRSLAGAVSFIFDKETETRNIISILAHVSYGADKSEVETLQW